MKYLKLLLILGPVLVCQPMLAEKPKKDIKQLNRSNESRKKEIRELREDLGLLAKDLVHLQAKQDTISRHSLDINEMLSKISDLQDRLESIEFFLGIEAESDSAAPSTDSPRAHPNPGRENKIPCLGGK